MIALEQGADEDMAGDRRDALTGLIDAVQAKARIGRWLDEWRAGSSGSPLHAMLIAVGRIDTVNLAYGATTGDSALVEIAQRLAHFATDEFETGDWFAARVAGAELAVVPGAAHGFFSDRPAESLGLLRPWLARHDA